jgi:hypothetical protein
VTVKSARTAVFVSLGLLVLGFAVSAAGSFGEVVASLGGLGHLPPPGSKIVFVEQLRFGNTPIKLDPQYVEVAAAAVLATVIVMGLAAYRRRAWARWPYLLAILAAVFPGPFPIKNIWLALQLTGDALMLISAAMLLLPPAREWFSGSR